MYDANCQCLLQISSVHSAVRPLPDICNAIKVCKMSAFLQTSEELKMQLVLAGINISIEFCRIRDDTSIQRQRTTFSSPGEIHIYVRTLAIKSVM